MTFSLTEFAIYILTVLNVFFLAIDARILHWIDFTLIFVLTLYAIYTQPDEDIGSLEIALPFANFMIMIVAGTVNILVTYVQDSPEPSWIFVLIFLAIYTFMAERHYNMYTEGIKYSKEESN